MTVRDARPELGERVAPDPWGMLWDQHHGEVVRYAAHLLGGDLHAAEDIAQETPEITRVVTLETRDLLRPGP